MLGVWFRTSASGGGEGCRGALPEERFAILDRADNLFGLQTH